MAGMDTVKREYRDNRDRPLHPRPTRVSIQVDGTRRQRRRTTSPKDGEITTVSVIFWEWLMSAAQDGSQQNGTQAH